MTILKHDINTLREIGSVKDRTYTKASFAVRIDFHFGAPLHTRPAALDPFLVRAADIIGPKIKKYGGTGGFAVSRGRKARAEDIAQLNSVSALMRVDYEEDEKETIATRRQVEAHSGKPTRDEHFKPVDSGSFFLGDTYSLEESENHIIMKGNGDWGVSLSFGIDIWEERCAEICDLAEDIFLSGVASSGTFGYALNLREWSSLEEGDLYFRPVVARFQMLNPVQPATLRFDPRISRGVFPPGCWYVLEDAWARQNGIDPADVGRLAGHVHAVQRGANGHLIKLWELPTLADKEMTPDIAPAKALSAFLLPAFDGAYIERPIEGRVGNHYRGLVIGEGEAARTFYLRFLQG